MTNRAWQSQKKKHINGHYEFYEILVAELLESGPGI